MKFQSNLKQLLSGEQHNNLTKISVGINNNERRRISSGQQPRPLPDMDASRQTIGMSMPTHTGSFLKIHMRSFNYCYKFLMLTSIDVKEGRVCIPMEEGTMQYR
jgi:hypothetical protein